MVLLVTIMISTISVNAYSEKEKTFPDEVRKVPYNAYVNGEYHFSIVPPESWTTETDLAIFANYPGDELIGFYLENYNPDFDPNFVISYQDIGKDVEVFHEYSDQEILDIMVDDLELGVLAQTKVTSKNINSFADGYVITVDYTQMVQLKEKSTPIQIESVTLILDSGDVYLLNFASMPEDFEQNIGEFRKSLETFFVGEVEKLSPTIDASGTEDSPAKTNDSKGGGCLIATAAFGSELAPQIQQLRHTRDNILLQTQSGTAFMTGFNQFYYIFSPTVADWERQNPSFKESIRIMITPLIISLSILNHLDIDSEAEMLAYGTGLILINIGMYFVAPAFIVMRLIHR